MLKTVTEWPRSCNSFHKAAPEKRVPPIISTLLANAGAALHAAARRNFVVHRAERIDCLERSLEM